MRTFTITTRSGATFTLSGGDRDTAVTVLTNATSVDIDGTTYLHVTGPNKQKALLAADAVESVTGN